MFSLRILLVEDHEIVRTGLKKLIERRDGFEVVGEAAAESEAIEQALAHEPDVVLMDVRLSDGNGINACRAILNYLPETRVLMLTGYAEEELLIDAIRAGAAGYVLKQINSDELIQALAAAAGGEAVIDSSLTQRIFERLRHTIRAQEKRAFGALSRREMEILALIADGKTNREIADSLFLSEGTVRNGISRILHKLEVSNRAEAAAYAVRYHLSGYV